MMIDFQVPISTTRQSIIASEFVGINDGAPSDCLDGQVEQSLGTDVVNNFDRNDAIPFKNAENRDFPGCTSTSITFSFASKIGFI